MDDRFSTRTNEVLSRAQMAILRARGLTTAFSSLREEVAEENQRRNEQLAQEFEALSSTEGMTTYTWPVVGGSRSAAEEEDAELSLELGLQGEADGDLLLSALRTRRRGPPVAGRRAGPGLSGPDPAAELLAAPEPEPRAHEGPAERLDHAPEGAGRRPLAEAPSTNRQGDDDEEELLQRRPAWEAESAAAAEPGREQPITDAPEDDDAGDNPYSCLREPVMLVAQRLANLQQQQAETMRQLLRLRLEQLRLRQQQLSALQCLLRTEAACIEGLHGNPLQLSAVQAAVDLLADSLEDVHSVASGLQWDGEVAQVAAVAQNVSEADSRAEEVSAMARQLLAALRRHPMHPRRELAAALEPAAALDEDELRGATSEEIAKHPTRLCTANDPVVGEQCSICLAVFCPGNEIRELQCSPPAVMHTFHRNCIDEWLGIKASCPLCKHEIIQPAQ